MNNLYFLLSIFFLILAGIFEGTETAFICTNPLTARREKNKLFQKYFKDFRTKPEHILSTMLISSNIALIISTGLMTLSFIHLNIARPSFWIGIFFPPVTIIFAQMLPKSIGWFFREKFIIYALPIFSFCEKLFHPLTALVDFFSSILTKIFFKRKPISWNKEDIKIMIDTLHGDGAINRAQKEAIADILEFSDRRAREVMLPLQNVVCLDSLDAKEHILEQARFSGFTRYPVYHDTCITGYINIFDLCYDAETTTWQEHTRKITVVGSSQKLADIFELLRRKKESIALVKKGNKSVGVLFLTDIMECILGSFTGPQESLR